MKTRIFVFGCMIAAAAIALSSCKEEEFTPGDPDVDGCYGVYFPEQETDLTLDPADETSLTIYVRRDSTLTSESLTVPYEFHDDTGVFRCEDDIYFPADSVETTITVTFDDADIGTTYTCYIQVTDPQYFSQYSSYASGIDISILREKWNLLGNCTYTDDLLGGVFGADPITYSVPIEENDLQPGLFRLLYPYGEIYPYNDSYDDGTADWDLENDWNIVVDATDPDRVFIDYQFLGIDWGYGPIYVESMASYYYRNGNSSDAIYNAGYYGTYKNGVITFPASGFMITMPDYSTTGYWYGNTNGAFKIALPGAADFSFTITADETVNGQTPIHFETTEDIASISYAIFTGSLSEAEVETAAQEIADGTVDSESFENDTLTCAYDLNVALAETGVYTLVAVSYDDTGDAQENASCEFCYLAAGDEMPVNVGVEIYATGKYSGHSSDNTLEFTIYGTDLTAVKYEIVKTNTYLTDPDSVEKEVKESDEVSATVLSTINASGGYTAYGTSYTAGTEYTIVVWASNGYESGFVTASAKTTGVFEATLDSLLGTYYVTETSYFGSAYDDYEKWVFVACDESDEEGYDFKLTYFDGWPCTSPIYGTIDLDNATFTIPDWQYFYTYAYYGYDFWFSTNSLDAVTFELTGDGSFTGADDLFGEYLCDAYVGDENDNDYYLGWNNAFSYVSGLRVSTSEDSIKPSSVRNLTPVGHKGMTIKVDPYARFIRSDSREVRSASFTATPAQAKVSTSTFVKGSAPAKAHKAVTSLN